MFTGVHHSDAPKLVNGALFRFMLNHMFHKVHTQPKTINHQINQLLWKKLHEKSFLLFYTTVTHRQTHLDAVHIRRTAGVHAEPSKVENDVLDGLMVNHIFQPVHLLPKSINYEINWLLFTAAYKRAHPFTLPSSFPLPPRKTVTSRESYVSSPV